MELHNLRPASGSTKKVKRIARGQGSGHGGTSTKGHKGDKARTGHKNKRGHEGGQMPLQMRLPKRGFKNINRIDYVGINLDRLETFATSVGLTDVTFNDLYMHGIVSKNDKVKILGGGELTKKINVSAHACTQSAKAAIEALGGTMTLPFADDAASAEAAA
jgi:large subunit ribosomal protein L15